ncbi:SigE family RNA polymerase sigma factor [Nonomuraea cavernae]|uniref:RNA polymerase subunit sigma-24 n=1 Tax=Nonomuraea cavernae TaxID=2045107 RepID=A0A918DKQ4_9ACTN|nr:SigE family RNA polymerase sigma factor [Nonomuraea cavernae]MCA2186541.1 SigE family RNA polymerase sigma factor [Nonomuraea cavernae]GGO71389.1 RNA polymerase subunit sigma-24 [Nonomuraea cavernae]
MQRAVERSAPPPHEGPPAEATAEDVLAELFLTQRLGLVRLAFLLVGDQETAEDVVQDAFAALHRRWGSLTDHDRVLPYLRASVVNGCRMVHRRRSIMGRITGDRQTPFWSAEAATLLGETRREVFKAVRGLPRRQREAVVLRYYLDLSEAEIAETMGISRGTVKSTVFRALKALTVELEGNR